MPGLVIFDLLNGLVRHRKEIKKQINWPIAAGMDSYCTHGITQSSETPKLHKLA